MINFHLRKHRVAKASFAENLDKEKKKSTEIGVEGNIMVPKNMEEEANVVIKLQFHLGDNNERLFMTLETVSIFEVINGSTQELTEEIVQQKCLPVALAELRKTVKKVSEAYGLPALDLAPFEGEDVEK